jgi:hypothetical protein
MRRAFRVRVIAAEPDHQAACLERLKHPIPARGVRRCVDACPLNGDNPAGHIGPVGMSV